MTDQLNWKHAAEFVGIGAIIASLIFVGYELRQTHVIATNEIRLETASSGFADRNAVNEFPEIWEKGVAGEELDRTEKRIFTNLVENFSRTAFWDWYTREEIGVSSSRTVTGFATFLHRNPGAMKVWAEELDQRLKYARPINAEASSNYTNPIEFSAHVRDELKRISSIDE